MDGGGSSRPTGSQTVVSTPQLPSFMEGPLKTAAGDAERLYKGGIGANPYPGATYVPPGADEMAGMARMRGLLGSNPILDRSVGQWGNLLGDRGISGDHMAALDPMKRIASGNINVGTGGAFGNLANMFGQQSFAERGLNDIAGGHGLYRQFDPHFADLANQMGGATFAQRHGTDIATGRDRINTEGDFRGLLAGASGPMASERYLADAAAGKFLGADGNPHFGKALDIASDRTMDSISGRMASMGRLGSDAHTGVAAREVGDLQTQARAQQHNLERQMQMQSAGQVDQSRLSRQAQQAGLVSSITGVQGQNLANRLHAAGLMDQSRMAQGGLLSSIYGQRAGLMGQDIANRLSATGQQDAARLAGLQGQMAALQGQTGVEAANIANQGQTAGMLADQFGGGRDAMMRGLLMSPMLRDMQMGDSRGLIDLGAAQRGELQDELQSNIDRFQGEDNAQWARLGLLGSTMQGMPDLASTRSHTTGTVPRGSPIAGLLGGAATGAGIGGSFGPMGAGIGGGLGGLLGLFM